jgi:hypothetical protein
VSHNSRESIVKLKDKIEERRFLLLLIALVALVLGYPVVHEEGSARLAYMILSTLVFVAAIRIVIEIRGRMIGALIFGVPTLLALWMGYAIPGANRIEVVAAFHICSAAFHLLMIATIVRAIHMQSEVTADGIYGAFCAYLLIGIAFGQLYCLADLLRPGSFRPDFAEGVTPQERHYALTYYSFITLTTVGYGDIVPVRGAVRSLAMAEALLGQFFIAGFIAELIGKRVAQILVERPPE